MEYPAMIYKSNKNGYVASCIIENLLGFGRTEEDAISDLRKYLKKAKKCEVIVKPMYNLWASR